MSLVKILEGLSFKMILIFLYFGNIHFQLFPNNLEIVIYFPFPFVYMSLEFLSMYIVLYYLYCYIYKLIHIFIQIYTYIYIYLPFLKTFVKRKNNYLLFKIRLLKHFCFSFLT